jgi:hypothetical protein
MIRCHLTSSVILLALLRAVSAYKSGVEFLSPSPVEAQLRSELTNSLLNGQIHQQEVYSRAVNILESMESAPSCYRAATLTLIDSCQSLERSTSTEVATYEIREEYATKLAMCELNGAEATISPHCAKFVPATRACKRQKLGGFLRRSGQTEEVIGKVCYPDITREQVKQCISTLHSKPQWWTSYSNALQNVVVICQASRSAIEKGKSSMYERFAFHFRCFRQQGWHLYWSPTTWN